MTRILQAFRAKLREEDAEFPHVDPVVRWEEIIRGAPAILSVNTRLEAQLQHLKVGTRSWI